MALFDFPLEQLINYKPDRIEPADFDAFWQSTLAETRLHPLDAEFVRLNNGLALIDSYDVTFRGYGGQPVRAWLNLPRQHKGPLPCVVEFIGYGGGRGFATDWLLWASAGYAHLVMDTRGQGSAWSPGDTPDLPDGANPFTPGFMTQGVLDPSSYYYRRLYADTVRAVDAARAFPAVDGQRIAVTGGSQGGGLTLAAAALDPTIALAMPDVPFLCHFRRATDLVDTYPYQEIVIYCKVHRDQVERVFETLTYFDGMNFAPRIRARSLFSVGLMDDTCPPSTVFAAYNHLTCEKDIRVYPYNRHEGGQAFHNQEKLKFVNAAWK